MICHAKGDDANGNAIFHSVSADGFQFVSEDPLNTGLDLTDGPSAAVLNSTLCLADLEAKGTRVMRAVYKP